MNRRELLKRAIPITPLAPVAIAEGVARYKLEPGSHFLFVVNASKVEMDSLLSPTPEGCDPLMPKGSKGGWIIPVYDEPDLCIKILRLDGEINAEEILGRPPDIREAQLREPPYCSATVPQYWNTKLECTSEVCHRPLPCPIHT